MGQTPGQIAEEGRDTSARRLPDSPDLESGHCVTILRQRKGQNVVVLGVRSIWQVEEHVKTFTVFEQNSAERRSNPELTPGVIMSFVFPHSYCKHTILLTGVNWVVKHGLSLTLKPKTE